MIRARAGRPTPAAADPPTGPVGSRTGAKTVTDRAGREFTYTPRYMLLGSIIAAMGLLGGTYCAGPVAVTIPSMMIFGRFPPQIAIATSVILLTFMNFGVLGAHVAAGAIVGRLAEAHPVLVFSPKVVTVVMLLLLIVFGVYLLAPVLL